MKKRILIKALLIHPNKNGFVSGIGRSNVELISALLALNDPDVEFSCYCVGVRSFRPLPYKWPIRCFSFPVLGRCRLLFDKWLEPFFRRFVIGYDLLHLTGNYDGVWSKENFVLTIHDLIEYQIYPRTRSRFLKCAQYSRAIFTCSEYSKEEIMRTLDVPEEKVHVVYWGINHSLFKKQSEKLIQSVVRKYGISTPYFFSCVGADSKNRKNSDITMLAFREMQKKISNYTLVFTWAACPNWLEVEFAKEIEERNIIILKGVSDEELACLYSGAIASYFISSAEGFGFPILESFACGTPCVTCRNTSLTEIGSDKAYFVKERDVEDTLLSMIYFVKHGKGDTDALMNYSKNFTWERAAHTYMQVYKKLINN